MIPRWLSWLMLGFLGYILFRGAPVAPPMESSDASSGTTVVAAPATYPALNRVMNVNRWKRVFDPAAAPPDDACVYTPAVDAQADLPLGVTELDAGGGVPAQCGEVISVALTIWDMQGKPAYHGEMKLTLGSHAVAVGLDAGLLGIAPSGVRQLVLPPGALVRAAETSAPSELLAALPGDRVALVTVVRLP